MKLNTKLSIFFLILIFVAIVPMVAAQEPVLDLTVMQISFWPDYDEPSVLVLMTGSLPANTTFPARVSIPIPENANVNAVARMNSEVGMADTEYEIVGNTLILTTPDPQFRVEYYVPYVEDGGWRSYDFVWNSDLDIQELRAEVQQPANAASLITEPPADSSVTNPSDGLIYHGMAPKTVAAGTPYELSFRYNASDSGLTAEGQGSVQEGLVAPVQNADDTNGGINWLYVLVGVGLLLVVVITWFVATSYSGKSNNRKPRKSQKPRKPGPRERSSSRQARFCHECGTQAETGDRFCRSCGTGLK